jgi:ABC-2 type transport system ATP-binding protein
MSQGAPIIETRGLTRKFRNNNAVSQLDLTVQKDSVYAFLGPNGAGKTTTIRMLLNIIKPSSGKAQVIGTDSRHLRSKDFQRIGYVSENQKLPLWMTVSQFMNYLQPLYPSWDKPFAAKLLNDFDLPSDRKLKHLSRGMRMKAALVGALAFRPELLVLDEPFSGLDPLVREEFLDGIIELTAQESWTIFISSHDIDEVERIADQVGVINEGSLLLTESIETLLSSYRKISLTNPNAESDLKDLPSNWLMPRQKGRLLSFTESRYDESSFDSQAHAQFPGLQNLSVETLSLKEIYLVIARNLKNEKTRSR